MLPATVLQLIAAAASVSMAYQLSRVVFLRN
jgi:hypothetical protein